MSISTAYDEKLLLVQIGAGNEKAFEQIFERYSDTIYGVAFAYTKSVEMSEEVVQDVFLKIWAAREKLSKIEDFSNYIFIITRNQLLNYLNRKTREKAYLQHLSRHFNENNISPEQELLYKESNELIEKAISLLPDQQKLVYQMVKVQGMKLEEAATVLDLSRNTVRNHLSRALQFIRSFIYQNGSELVLTGSLILFPDFF